jgi:MSHA pilin protein MshC
VESNYRGFTLVELVAVLVIIGILAVSVASKFSSSDVFQTQASRDDIVAALFFSQQVAMARGSSTNGVRFVSNGSSFTVQESGTDLINGNVQYPFSLPSGYSLTSATLNYDKLGRTSATNLTLSKGSTSAVIAVSGSGYAR